MLRQHYKQNHHVCDKAECFMLVFEDAYTLTAHYLKVHGERRYTKVEFGFIDDDEDSRKKKMQPAHQAQPIAQHQPPEEIKDEEFPELSAPAQDPKVLEENRKKYMSKKEFPSLP